MKAAVDGRSAWEPLQVKQSGVIYVGIGTQGVSRARDSKNDGLGTEGIPIAKPTIDEREAEAVRRVILKGWVTQGPEVGRFEREFATFVGSPHACAVSNCTTALHLALLALGVKDGDEVITVSHSFIATANAIRYCRATPVFVDIQPGTFNMDPSLVEAAVTDRTKAILCVHQLGMPCDLAGILEVGKRRKLPVIEDAACAIGSEILWNGRWEHIGRPHGDIACFSFHPRKVVTTGDGGMITTANPDYDAQFRLWRQHGMSVPDAVRHGSQQVIFESYPVMGYNYRMTDVQAAIGREQLNRLPDVINRRRQLAAVYRTLLGSVAGLTLPMEPDWARTNWQSYCVRLPQGIDQKSVMQTLLDKGIATRRGVLCAHREAAYGQQSWRPASSLKESERAQDECILLPLYHQLRSDEQEFIASQLQSVLRFHAHTHT
jgi:perosamine synthetase